MSDRVALPIDTARLVLERRNIGMANSSIEIDDNANIIPRGPDNGASHTVIVRKATNSGDRPRNAKKLSACKGLKGCEFAECAKDVFGKLPKNLEGLCSTE